MRNKYKLKGEKIYIENDLTYEKRKVQEKMSKARFHNLRLT